MIPDGPLHLDHALAALAVAGGVAFLSRRSRWFGPIMAVTFLALFAWRQPGVLSDVVTSDRWSVVDGVLAVGAGVAFLAIARMPWMTQRAVFGATVAASVAVWATAPDTEGALIAGIVALVSAVAVAGRTGLKFSVFPLVVVIAALTGTVGRPERLELVLSIAFVGFVGFAAGVGFAERWLRGRGEGIVSRRQTAPAPAEEDADGAGHDGQIETP